MNLLVFAVSFVLVFLCSLVALKWVEGFSGCARWLMAACVAILSGLGLIALVGDGPRLVGPDLLGLLLPYAALGATLIALLLLMIVVNVHRSFRDALRRNRRRRDVPRRTHSQESLSNGRPSIGDGDHDWRLPCNGSDPSHSAPSVNHSPKEAASQ